MESELGEDKLLSHDVTLLLKDWGRGESEALSKLVPAVYSELRAMAGRYFRTEKDGQTLCATALVNEVYVRMAEGERIIFQDREHFFGIAGRMMRRILVEHARKRLTQKRGGNLKVTLNEDTDGSSFGKLDLATMIAVNDALESLEQEFPRAARILEWRVFGGLNNSEIASVSGYSLATVKREWALAKQRLFVRLRRSGQKSN